MELKFDKKENQKERVEFIHYYAKWVNSVPNEVWSKQQAELIDSFMTIKGLMATQAVPQLPNKQ